MCLNVGLGAVSFGFQVSSSDRQVVASSLSGRGCNQSRRGNISLLGWVVTRLLA